MDLNNGMLPMPAAPGTTNDAEVRAAILRLVAKGMPITPVNVAEEMAIRAQDAARPAPQAPAGRGGPTSEIANRETPQERETRLRREAEQQRMDEARKAFNARRGQVVQ